MTTTNLPAMAERIMNTSSDMRWLAGQAPETVAATRDITRDLEAAQESISQTLIALTDTDPERKDC